MSFSGFTNILLHFQPSTLNSTLANNSALKLLNATQNYTTSTPQPNSPIRTSSITLNSLQRKYDLSTVILASMRYHDSTRQCRLQRTLNLDRKAQPYSVLLVIPICLASACSVSKLHPDRQAGKAGAHSVGLLAYDTLSFNQK